MSQTILIKRSSVPGKAPTVGNLDPGELAINTHDGKIFLKKNVLGVETIVEVGATIVTGDVTGTGNDALTLTLASTGVVSGTYTKVTVDTKGRITSGTTLSSTDIPSLDWAKITSGKPTTIAGYGITDSPVINPTVAKDGDIKIASGVISIFASAAWKQIYPAVYS